MRQLFGVLLGVMLGVGVVLVLRPVYASWVDRSQPQVAIGSEQPNTPGPNRWRIVEIRPEPGGHTLVIAWRTPGGAVDTFGYWVSAGASIGPGDIAQAVRERRLVLTGRPVEPVPSTPPNLPREGPIETQP